jgi:hypothetical protein
MPNRDESLLDLLTGEIVVWNNAHWQGCLKKRRADGYEHSEEVLVQIFESRQTESIFNFSLRGKHCFPYLQDHGSWTSDL